MPGWLLLLRGETSSDVSSDVSRAWLDAIVGARGGDLARVVEERERLARRERARMAEADATRPAVATGARAEPDRSARAPPRARGQRRPGARPLELIPIRVGGVDMRKGGCGVRLPDDPV